MADWPIEYQVIKQAAELAGIPTGLPQPAVIIGTIINTVLSVVGVIAVLIIIYGGYLWLTSLGNEEKIRRAKMVLTDAVIGLTIIFSAYATVSFLLTALSYATGR